MPWNEPSGNQKDPWSKKPNQGPPGLDEVFRKIQQFLLELFGGKQANKPKNNGSRSFSAINILLIILSVFLASYCYKAVYIVNEKERAVVLRFGKYLETVGPGLHFYLPFIDTKDQRMVTNYRIYKIDQEMLTKDENIVQVGLSVQYNIADLKKYELNVANPILSLEEATQSALRHVVGSSSMHHVLTEGREIMADEVRNRLQNYLDNYGTGLFVSRVNVESSQPPKQVQSAFDDVIRAREDEERSKNNAQAYANQVIPEARGQAKKIIEEANAYKSEVVSLAEGQASRFKSVLDVYNKNPSIMRTRLYLNTMQKVLHKSTKVLVSDKKEGNIFYLPLDKLMKSDEVDNSEKAIEPVTQSAIINHLKSKNDSNPIHGGRHAR